MGEDDTQAFITALSLEKSIPIDLSKKDKDDLLNVIREWVDDKIDMATKKMEGNLPDCIEYGGIHKYFRYRLQSLYFVSWMNFMEHQKQVQKNR